MSAVDRDREFVLLAHLIRTQGRHGELIADILTDYPERFADRRHVWLLPPDAKGAAREAKIERHWLHKGRVVLKFVGVDSISDAAVLSGSRVAILAVFYYSLPIMTIPGKESHSHGNWDAPASRFAANDRWSSRAHPKSGRLRAGDRNAIRCRHAVAGRTG